MTILTIECSSSTGSIALTRHGETLQHTTFENPRGRGTAFFEALLQISHKIETLDLVLVGTGPGSYNSLRTSLAAAWGLARALGARLRGICSLLGYEPEDYDVIGDARANQWFHAQIRSGILTVSPALLTPQEARAALTLELPVFSTSALGDEACCRAPDAIHLARRLAQASAPEPIYLKPPHITKPSA